MEKLKVTSKIIKRNFANIICVDYCHLNFLLYCKDAQYYNATNGGWNYDIYVINDNTCISSGYRAIGNINPSYKSIDKYNHLGELLVKKTYVNDDIFKQRQNKLLMRFIRECIREVNI